MVSETRNDSDEIECDASDIFYTSLVTSDVCLVFLGEAFPFRP